MAALALRFLKSAPTYKDMGPSKLELAVAGRSNVGKSSLINALANRNGLAKVSKTPGATRLLNIYEYGDPDSGNWVVDLPGFGYAKASKGEQARWAKMIDDYLAHRDTLGGVLLLIDGLIGPTDLDLQSLEWFEHVGVPVSLVATKDDKVKPSKRPQRRRDLAAKSRVKPDEVRWVSSLKGTGVPELRTEIHQYFTS
ncbi:MAG: ribosome biogenesis GTP-binding protein YihA/YsxC [Acidimicrobiales bacterium]